MRASHVGAWTRYVAVAFLRSTTSNSLPHFPDILTAAIDPPLRPHLRLVFNPRLAPQRLRLGLAENIEAEVPLGLLLLARLDVAGEVVFLSLRG